VAFEHALGVVREGRVADVVDDGRGADAFGLRPLDAEMRQRAAREVVDAERVFEPRVVRARVDELRGAELFDAPEPLDGRRVE